MSDEKQRDPSKEISGNDFVDAQTKSIEREFKTSKPRPRHDAMGFPPRKRAKKGLRFTGD